MSEKRPKEIQMSKEEQVALRNRQDLISHLAFNLKVAQLESGAFMGDIFQKYNVNIDPKSDDIELTEDGKIKITKKVKKEDVKAVVPESKIIKPGKIITP